MTLPVLVLGLVRVVPVKSTQYPVSNLCLPSHMLC
jgi:hypothetical protein